MISDRGRALRMLIEYQLPIEFVLGELRSSGWDSAQDFAVITKEDVIAILNRYMNDELSSQQVIDWANLIECREDIGFPLGEGEILPEIIFRLANPNLEGEVTTAVAAQIKEGLRNVRSSN
jgi:hypothetical protein